jgi:plastocyanin
MRSKLIGFLVALVMMISACAGAPTLPNEQPATGPLDPSAVPGLSAAPTDSIEPGSTSTAPSSNVVAITIGTDDDAGLKFDPGIVTVPAGAKVRVTLENHATVPHNLTFDAPISLATSTVVAPGTSETVEFRAPEPGDYGFVCTLHPGMGGTLTVQAS